jgi:hypothetical protein
MLQDRGRLAEAVAALRRADELGAGSRLGYPSRDWLAEARRWLALEPRLPALLEGKVKVASPEERLDWAGLCLSKDRPHRAVVLYREAFLGRPGLADVTPDRHSRAIRSAVRAGCGRDEDADKLTEKERAEWRKQALDWLNDDLGTLLRQTRANSKFIRRLLFALEYWRFDVTLAPVREPGQLKKLPADEQRQWQKFWEQVERLNRKLTPQK